MQVLHARDIFGLKMMMKVVGSLYVSKVSLTFIRIVDTPEAHAHNEAEARHHREHPDIEACALRHDCAHLVLCNAIDPRDSTPGCVNLRCPRAGVPL